MHIEFDHDTFTFCSLSKCRNLWVEYFLKNIQNFKIFEYAIKINLENQIPIWVCCKLYEHVSVDDETNFDEYSNSKIIYLAYESHNPINIDNFCQDLLLYELFI